MKNSTIRYLVILAVICIVGITVTQIYWVKRAFDLKEAEFERTVQTALFNVAQQLFDINQTPSPALNPVKQVSTNYFVVMVNSEIEASLLEFLLKSEFERRDIKADFEYGVYDCVTEKMVYGNYVSMKSSVDQSPTYFLPAWSSQGYYFGVQFPYREAHILNQMGIWTYSSLVLVVVIAFFSYSLFIILKQKRLSDIQKDFINNMTHEFRTPISTISISTEVLKNPGIVNQPERLLNYATIIETENNRLRQQVDRVLHIAKLEREDVHLKSELIDGDELIRETIKNFTPLLQENHGTISYEPGATLTQIQGDRLHLSNALNNLFDNAIKYCDQKPFIIIRTDSSSQYFIIEVQDNGIGINAEDRKRIFQKFYRVSTGNVHNIKGFGLGLSYVRHIISAHGGTIKVKSTPSQGSQFTIELPHIKR